MTKARDIASAIPAPSTVSSAELGFLDGVTSAIQTQIDSKIGSASAINPTIVDAKGDIIAATAADTVARLAVGANGTVLTAASGQATGLEWATPAGGGANFTLVNASGTALTGASTITVSGITNANSIMIVIDSANAPATSQIQVLLNGATANYKTHGMRITAASSYSASLLGGASYTDRIAICEMPAVASSSQGFVLINGANSTGLKAFNAAGGVARNASSEQVGYVLGGVYDSSSTISSISLVSTVGNFNSGTVFVYKA